MRYFKHPAGDLWRVHPSGQVEYAHPDDPSWEPSTARLQDILDDSRLSEVDENQQPISR